MYKILYKSNQENVGIALWYKYGTYNKPLIIFATGRHGNQKNQYPCPYMIDLLHKNKPLFLYDDQNNIISGYFSAISIDKNLILFAGNIAKGTVENSRLYLISPKTNICKLKYTFIIDNKFVFSARCCLIRDKTVIIGGTCGLILVYNFNSKNKLINNRIINISSIDNIIVGLNLNESILSVGIRIRSFEIKCLPNIDKQICYPSSGKFAKSAIINLCNNNIKYFTTNMQCTSIYYNKNYIICIGSGQKKYYSQCFYIPIDKNKKFGKKVNLAICDGRDLIVYNDNLFILCVTDPHIYIENFTNSNRKYNYIKNINSPCRGCVLYDYNKIIISSIGGTSVILNLDKICIK